ncbi:putative nucleotidyltransferase with HDIG domain [Thermosporothrix hazakensis]|jgi:putative nucleotidyltransferase with HDIG domain|uniref:Putative nucleotidyltransferase with HDIG domain n=1 Tax=Thermosporothrix hazakensis TaxID=644383 RepID=A0A326UJ00_THEHA|nr:HD domain-containing protein [Thermosporothrix hazakensis]PZW36710.1 putative nucleotidyltransferase with HDIG domain [Thermosporothrix hazakensis]GCE47361.1 HDIG domain-containing protein [Thermosporothrix hazakensis]
MPTREDAYRLMTSHVKNVNLQKHMLSVEAAMRFYARKYGEDEELWGIAGLLHDCDYEEYPDLERHTQVAAHWLREEGYDERIIYAILAHNDLNQETNPRNDLLSRALFACDEITGMITATALVRPNKSVIGLEVSSVRKKMKSKGFAAGVNREDLVRGAEELGIPLEEHIANVIQAMSEVADQLGLRGTAA